VFLLITLHGILPVGFLTSMPVTSISTLQTHDSLSSYPFNVTNTLTQAMTKPSNSFLVTGKLLLQRVRYFCHYSAKAATQTT
jgi:hypothetical protein